AGCQYRCTRHNRDDVPERMHMENVSPSRAASRLSGLLAAGGLAHPPCRFQDITGGKVDMDLHLRGKTALVTGASKGIGLACARQLAEEGCHLPLASRTKADLERAKEQIQSRHNVSVTVHPVDLSNGDAARSSAAGGRDSSNPGDKSRRPPRRRPE